MTRARLPTRRASEALAIEHDGHMFRLQVSFYPGSGTIGEVFVNAEKTNSSLDALAGDVAILLSLLLQHAATPLLIGHALRRNPDGRRASLIGVVTDKLAELYPADERAPALELEPFGETDPRVDVAYQALKSDGHLVPKGTLALALSRALGDGSIA